MRPQKTAWASGVNGKATKMAMARSRARRMALAAKRAGAEREPMPLPEPETLLSAELAVDDQLPVDDADVDEPAPQEARVSRSQPVLMLVVDEEEEAEFCQASPSAPALAEPAPVQLIDDSAPEAEEPPFDPPDLDELLSAAALEDEEPPFDPMDAEELTPPTLSVPIMTETAVVPAPANENGRGVSLGPVRNAVPEGARDRPAPAINILMSWDRPQTAELFAAVAADRRLARADIAIARGGLDGAAVRCTAHRRPDLLIIDTTLRGAAMLASLDRLMHAAGQDAKVIIIGALNDVTLLRELAGRGVDEYLVSPVAVEAVAGAACALFADVDKARVIAVVGARGGIGASTLAHNLAWSIAERQRARTVLVDLDLPFGTAAFDFCIEAPRSLAEALDQDQLSDVALERVAVKRSDRLTIISAPATPRHVADLETETAQTLIAAARRLSSVVILDLPHLWAPWVRQALLDADEIVLTSSPDLASLRNTDNIAKLLKAERKRDPTVVLSMAGVPGRPEVPFKEFAHALGITPEFSFAFEPNIFGAAEITGQMLGEMAPGSKAAIAIDQLATLLTGRELVDALEFEPRIFEDACDREGDVDEAAPHAADPFEQALVNPFALLDPDEDAPDCDEPAPAELAPLDLLELAPSEPTYIARARAAALDELDAIEHPRRGSQGRRGFFGRLAGAAGGLALGLTAGVAWQAQTKSQAAVSPPPAPRAVAALEAPPAATPQHLATEYLAALQLIEGGAVEEGAARLQQLAESGFAAAQYRLAKLYERGQGVEPNLALARQWTERAAAAGNRHAMHDLGVYFARGEGGPRDEAGAARLFLQAAERDLADSQFNLGVLYEQGRGVEASPADALFWFLLAARQGDAAAAARAEALEKSLTLFEAEQAHARAADFRPRVVDAVADGEFGPALPAQGIADAQAPESQSDS